MKKQPAPQTMSLDELAKVLDIGRNSAYRAASEGTLPVPVYRAGRRWIVPREPVERLLRGEL